MLKDGGTLFPILIILYVKILFGRMIAPLIVRGEGVCIPSINTATVQHSRKSFWRG
jgi:hypothetical protein